MSRLGITLSLLLFSFILTTSCTQNNTIGKQIEATEKEVATVEREPHQYGGWFCPDNFGGFPPIDIKDLDKVPVVNDRLPTEEETKNGTSLLFIDKEKYPDAKPLNMTFPKVARVFSKHNNMNELIIVIQGVVVGKDTVVGFRYPNGGNGSAWYDDVTFLSEVELNEMGPAPFVYYTTEISASKEKIWKALASTTYAKKLAKTFDKKDFFESDWTDESVAHLNLDTDDVKANGIVTTLWGNLYIQVDYDKGGFHFSEKILLGEKKENNKTELHIVSGPYPKDEEEQKVVWEKWVQEVKSLSEAK